MLLISYGINSRVTPNLAAYPHVSDMQANFMLFESYGDANFCFVDDKFTWGQRTCFPLDLVFGDKLVQINWFKNCKYDKIKKIINSNLDTKSKQ